MTYKTSPIKRHRRSKSEIETLRGAMVALLAAEQLMTIRHLFYRLVSKGVIPKTEAAYNGTVCRLLAEMRREGSIPFEWLVDGTRWMRKPQSFSSLESALDNCRQTYRRALWDSQEVYAEVWCEKDAIASILYEETAAYDVPLMVCRGFSSLSFIHNAAQAIKEKRKPTFIFYFGDYDPSGLSISATLERDLKEFAGTTIYFQRLAITPQQIVEWELPTRPTKGTDSRAKNFDGESVEVDAVDRATLQQLCSDAITDLIDTQSWNSLVEAEKSERESLAIFQQAFGGIN